MKYRAILIDPGAHNQERPVQILTNTLQDAKMWAYGDLSGNPEGARGVLRSAVAEDAAVIVYETIEQKRAVWPKKIQKKSEDPK